MCKSPGHNHEKIEMHVRLYKSWNKAQPKMPLSLNQAQLVFDNARDSSSCNKYETTQCYCKGLLMTSPQDTRNEL